MFFEFLHADRFADDRIGMELHTKFAKSVYLDVHDVVRQTEFRNTVFEYSSDFVERLEDVNLISVFGGISGKGQARRTGADDGDLAVSRWSLVVGRWTSLTITIVGAETLQITYRNSRVFHLEMDTIRLALFLLRANATTDSGERRTLFDDCCSAENISCFERLDEARNIDVYRTTLYAGRVLAVEAAMALRDGLFESQALVHFFVKRFNAYLRTQFRHLNPLYGCTIFGSSGEGFYGADIGGASLTSCTSYTSCTSSRLISLECLCFFGAIGFHAAEHFIPIDSVSVEFRSIHADEFGLTTYGNTTRAAHSCAIHHDGIQRSFGRNIVFGGRERHEFHHDGRSNRDTFVHFLAVDDLLYPDGNYALLSR